MKEKLRGRIAHPLLARNRQDTHRAATPLELLFDLIFVIAIASAAAGLHHALAEHHYLEGGVRFLLAFFILWWPWVHFTWFASAFDNDDPLYRIAVMVMMFGLILIAASLPGFFATMELRLSVVGYVLVRLTYAFLWYRAGQANPEYRATASRYIRSLSILQIGWVLLSYLGNPHSPWFLLLLMLGIAAELYVPVYANRANRIPWHKHHIIERHGLLNIIVLGEILLAATLAIQATYAEAGHYTPHLLFLAVCASIVTFGIWWLYFCDEKHLEADTFRHIFTWGYGHFLIYAPGAAIGAGFAALVDALGGHGSTDAALWLISLSVALYIAGLWLIRERHILHSQQANVLLLFAGMILLTPLLSAIALPAMTLMIVVTLVYRLNIQQKPQAQQIASTASTSGQ